MKSQIVQIKILDELDAEITRIEKGKEIKRTYSPLNNHWIVRLRIILDAQNNQDFCSKDIVYTM